MSGNKKPFSAFFAKISRDTSSGFWRLVVLGIVLGAGIFVLTGVLVSAGILLRELGISYESTNPASATIELKTNADQKALDLVKGLPGIIDARIGQTLKLRVQDGGGNWQPILVFVSPELASSSIWKVKSVFGPWPPKRGTIALERTALSTFGWKVGDLLNLKTEEGKSLSAVLETVVHDPSVAPAYQERTVYSYGESKTLEQWGLLDMNEVKIRTDQSLDTPFVRRIAAGAAVVLSKAGYEVEELQVPPAHKHPHQGILLTLLAILAIFGILTIILSSLMAANAAASSLAREKKSIGILKTIGVGALPLQIMVLTPLVLTGILASAWGVPAGLSLGPMIAKAIGRLLNFDFSSLRTELWTWLVPLTVGILMPVGFGLPVSVQTQRLPVLKALNDQETDNTVYEGSRKISLFARTFPVLKMSLFNSWRKKKRLVLSLLLMGIGGGLFMTSANLTLSWQTSLREGFKARKFDYQLRLLKKPSSESLTILGNTLPGLKNIELWPSLPASAVSAEGLAVDSTYPDQAHGSFRAFGIPDSTTMFRYPVLEGKWAHGKGEAVLNQNAILRFPEAKIGGPVKIYIAGSKRTFRLAGVVKEFGQAAAFIDPSEWADFSPGMENRTDLVLSLDPAADQKRDRSQTQAKIVEWVQDQGIPLEVLIDSREFEIGGTEHFSLLIVLILIMGLVTGTVGWLGISSMLSMAVIERRREFGIMRTIGAGPKVLVGSLLAEAGVMITLGCAAAALISLPLAGGLGAFLSSLPLVFNFPMAWFWLFISLAGGLTACLFPALDASRQAVRKTLAA